MNPKPEVTERDREMADRAWYELPTDAVMFWAREEQVKAILASLFATARAEGEQQGLERAALLYDSIDHECDHDKETLGPTSHPGGMGIVIRYRDAIRALAAKEEGEK